MCQYRNEGNEPHTDQIGAEHQPLAIETVEDHSGKRGEQYDRQHTDSKQRAHYQHRPGQPVGEQRQTKVYRASPILEMKYPVRKCASWSGLCGRE